MARPRLQLPEEAIVEAFRHGTSMSQIATQHGVDRGVIRRIITSQTNNVLAFPDRIGRHLPEGHYSSYDLIERAGITFRQLDWWTRTGILNARPRTVHDSGYPREYPAIEVVVACLVKQLLDGQVELRRAAEVARELLDTGTSNIAGFPIHLPEEH